MAHGKKSRFKEGQIVGLIRQAEGMPVRERRRWSGFSDAGFFKWRAKYGDRDVAGTK